MTEIISPRPDKGFMMKHDNDVKFYVVKYNGRWIEKKGKETWKYDTQKFVNFENAYRLYNVVNCPKEICVELQSGFVFALNDLHFEEYLKS